MEQAGIESGPALSLKQEKMTLSFHSNPCSSCPYRRDCLSGVWHESEYMKLAEYDKDTSEQPPAYFLCHDGDRKNDLCRGWLDTHDKTELLALRLGVAYGTAPPDIFDLPSSEIPTFSSGTEAMLHGLDGIEKPSLDALGLIDRLREKSSRREE